MLYSVTRYYAAYRKQHNIIIMRIQPIQLVSASHYHAIAKAAASQPIYQVAPRQGPANVLAGQMP